MKITYEVLADYNTIKATDENGKEYFIPMDEANSDYQRYLRWVEDPEAEENGTISQDLAQSLKIMLEAVQPHPQ